MVEYFYSEKKYGSEKMANFGKRTVSLQLYNAEKVVWIVVGGIAIVIGAFIIYKFIYVW